MGCCECLVGGKDLFSYVQDGHTNDLISIWIQSQKNSIANLAGNGLLCLLEVDVKHVILSIIVQEFGLHFLAAHSTVPYQPTALAVKVKNTLL